jgi:GT2 family glycosyltransferase
MADIDIVIVSYNTREMLRACLVACPAACGRLTSRVYVVDNASKDGSAEMVAREFPDVHLLRNSQNVGFAVSVK